MNQKEVPGKIERKGFRELAYKSPADPGTAQAFQLKNLDGGGKNAREVSGEKDIPIWIKTLEIIDDMNQPKVGLGELREAKDALIARPLMINKKSKNSGN